MNREIQPGA